MPLPTAKDADSTAFLHSVKLNLVVATVASSSGCIVARTFWSKSFCLSPIWSFVMFDCSRRTSANARRRSRRRRCKSRPRRARRRRRPDAREREDAHFKSSLNALKCVAFLDKKKSFWGGGVTSDEISKKRHMVLFNARIRSAITTTTEKSLPKTTPTDSPVSSSRLPRWFRAFYIWQT